jgi:hypothetical protein
VSHAPVSILSRSLEAIAVGPDPDIEVAQHFGPQYLKSNASPRANRIDKTLLDEPISLSIRQSQTVSSS